MESIQLILLVIQIIVAVMMIILVLLQKSDGDSLSGIGGGSGGLNSVVSSKTTANALSKITMFLVAIFMINCLILASISNSSRKNKQIQEDLEKIIIEQENKTSTNQEENQTKPIEIPKI